MRNATTALLAIGAVLLLATALYWPALDGPFLLDDPPNIFPAQIEVLDWHELAPVVFGNTSGSLGRPVSVLTFSLTGLAHGLDPWYFKYHNLLIHLLTGLLLFWLAGRLIQAVHPQTRPGSAWLAAGASATLWLVHPLLVSTVMYPVQRMAELSALFTVAAVLGYVIGRQSIDAAPRRALVLMALAYAGFGLLAVFSKENGALLPLYVLAIEWFIFRQKAHTPAGQRRLNRFVAGAVILPLLAGLAYFILRADTLLSGFAFRPFTLEERLLSEAVIVWGYIKQILLPVLSGMSLYQDGAPIIREWGVRPLLAIAGFLGLIWTALRFRVRFPLLSLGIAWFFISHLLESTVFALELAFEHRNYLATFGFTLILASLPLSLADRTRRRAAAGLVAIMLGLFATLTHLRADLWGQKEVFLHVAVAENPASTRARSDLANHYLFSGNVAKARTLLDEVIAQSGNAAGPQLHKLMTYCYDEQLPGPLLASTKASLRSAVLTPYATSALSALNDLHMKGRCSAARPEQMVALARSATENEAVRARFRVYLYAILAKTYASMQAFPRAASAYLHAVALERHVPPPERAKLRQGLIRVYLAGAQFEAAEEQLAVLKRMNAGFKVQADAAIADFERRLTRRETNATVPADARPRAPQPSP